MHDIFFITERLLDVVLANCSNKGFSSIGGIKVFIGTASLVMPVRNLVSNLLALKR
jgi:hypothetical protein